MAKCVNCQAELPEGGMFCPNCGARIESAQQTETQPAAQQPVQPEPQPAPQPAQPSYQQPTYQQPTYQQPSYQQPSYQQPSYQAQPADRKKSVGLLVWSIIMIVLSAFSCSIIPLILSIIACVKVNGASKAATDNDELKCKKSAKGLLIASVVLYCIGFIIVGAFFTVIPILGSSFGSSFEYNDFFNQFGDMYMMFRLF